MGFLLNLKFKKKSEKKFNGALIGKKNVSHDTSEGLKQYFIGVFIAIIFRSAAIFCKIIEMTVFIFMKILLSMNTIERSPEQKEIIRRPYSDNLTKPGLILK